GGAGQPGGDEASPRAWLRALRQLLPEYMVPAAVVALPSLPRTASGKVDRKLLPPVDLAAPARDGADAAAGEVEARIAAVWRSVLGTPAVGMRDNFFDVGGNSLLLLRLQRELAAALGVELAVTDLMRFPTIRTLAELIEHRQPARRVPAPAGRGPARRRRRVPAVRPAAGAAAPADEPGDSEP
ncbi:MAG TPA: phosphopantetheine-binding protein, partial [Thermoanaerobaculia bacterium]|nr:phosphopantetheine-binding protein [Thermoanaerobaculia bacterium]